jgi:hypothetical protein
MNIMFISGPFMNMSTSGQAEWFATSPLPESPQ